MRSAHLSNSKDVSPQLSFEVPSNSDHSDFSAFFEFLVGSFKNVPENDHQTNILVCAVPVRNMLLPCQRILVLFPQHFIIVLSVENALADLSIHPPS